MEYPGPHWFEALIPAAIHQDSLKNPQEVSEHSLKSTALSHLQPFYKMNYFFKSAFQKQLAVSSLLKQKYILIRQKKGKCRIGSENRIMCKLFSSLKDWKGKIPLNFLTQNIQQASISLHILATALDVLHSHENRSFWRD